MNQKVEYLLNQKGGNYIFPFFWQHGEDETVLRKYMKVIDESNIKAVCVESRPHPDFCGDKWWQDMDVILDEAERRNMKVWILDDSHFPTGFANGAMKERTDELCRQSICCRIYETEGKERIQIGEEEIRHPDEFQMSTVESFALEKNPRKFNDDSLLALYAVRMEPEKNGFEEEKERLDLRPLIENDTLDWKVPEGKWKVYALHLSRNHGYHRSYINMMNRDSCKVLLDAVYEPHYAHYKKYFGTIIEVFFSDEPELGNGHLYDMEDEFGRPIDYPWSEALGKQLEEKLGKDFGMLLALLWENGAGSAITAKVRYAYMDAVTELVKECFSEQVGAWCRKRGVRYIGHLIEDDNHHSRTGSSLGHYFRGLAGQDMAGIDDIGGQVFPQGEEISYNKGIFQHRNGEFYHYMLGKLGSSAAAIEPRKKGDSMCEIFGNYGWSEGVRLEKYLADHFLVRGINHYVPHAFSPKEFPDLDCPPHFYAHGHNPQYRHFGWLMAYMNRVCELISGGKHIAPVAVIYHAEGDWTGKYMTGEKIGHVLANAQIEYDFIPQDVFAKRNEYHTEIKEGIFTVNTQKYSAVVVPYMQYVTSALAHAIEELRKNEIEVLFVEGCPEGICDAALGADSMETISGKTVRLEKLCETLRKKSTAELFLIPSDNRIRYMHYQHQNGTDVYMIVNEGIKKYSGVLHFTKATEFGLREKVLYEYHAWENRIEQVAIMDDAIQLEIEPLKSRIFVFDSSTSKEEINSKQVRAVYDVATKEEMDFCGNWKRSICESIAYPAFEKEKEITFPDMLAEGEPEFSGFVRYENCFTGSATDRLYLEITDAYEGVEVFVNEQSLGIQIVPRYRFDLSNAVKTGENRLRIEVATTLERAMAKVPNQFGQVMEAASKSGITGSVRLWKVK